MKIKIYKIIILPVVLYGCETWSLTPTEEHRLRMFENRVLRRIFGPKEEVVGGWRRLHSEELRNFYTSPILIRVIYSMKWVEHVARTGEMRNVYDILFGKPEGKGPVERLGRRWKDNIRMDLREISWEVVDWMHLAHDRDKWRALVNTVMNLQVPENAWNFLIY
jgi:hypothetical protein